MGKVTQKLSSLTHPHVVSSYKTFINLQNTNLDMKSSDAKASKCHLKYSSKIRNVIRLLYLCLAM